MAINLNEGGVVKSITTDITAFISAIDLIAEDLPFTNNVQHILSLDYDYRFLIILHNLNPNYLPTQYKITSQVVDMNGLMRNPGIFLYLMIINETSTNKAYGIRSNDATGREITLISPNHTGCYTVTILGTR
ncbi:MAG: hypothetical protein J6Y02_24190 [Pseudobutyrivibrio sp.]|nr:hypothetical protein [Pseudobutyrivibrio sp.]